MLARNCDVNDLHDALDDVNKRFAGNIKFREITVLKNAIRFILWVKDCKGPGHRLGNPKFCGFGKPLDYSKRKRMPYACWHVHGYFFDALLETQPKAVVVAGGSLANPRTPSRITINGGNWEDWNIGTKPYPYYFSETCECQK